MTEKSVFDLITEIANHTDQEEPFFVVDLADIVYKYKLWKLKMPRVQPFYAVKCNDSTTVLHLLAALGTGFDCASKNEIENVLAAGVEPSRIIYANPCKTRSFIKHAESVDVNLTTFDNEMELRKMKLLHPHCRLVIRIRVDDSGALCRLGMKFGCDVEDVSHLLNIAKELGLNVVGVSFHVGSGCQDSSAFTKAVASARQVFDIAADIGYNFELLDIGGGFPGSKGPFVSFEEIASVINTSLDQLFPPESGVQIIAEPGRYFVASAFTLCTNIIAKREVVPDEEGGETSCMYYVNDGVYGSFNCLIFDHAEVQPIPLMDTEDRNILKCSLWGPTCDSMDRILETSFLPEMNVGEWIIFENMGAYTVAAASTFNGFQKPVIKCVLPMHALSYLQQLPSWSKLLEVFGTCVPDLGQPDVNDNFGHHSKTDVCMLPYPESVSA